MAKLHDFLNIFQTLDKYLFLMMVNLPDLQLVRWGGRNVNPSYGKNLNSSLKCLSREVLINHPAAGAENLNQILAYKRFSSREASQP